MAKSIKNVAHKIELGRANNFDIQTMPGFAIYEAVDAESGLDSRGRKRKRWRDYDVENCIYAPELRGAILQPTCDINLNMSLDDIEILSGTFDVCKSSNNTANSIWSTDGTPASSSCCVSTYLLPPTPYFSVFFDRPALPPQGIAWEDQFWSFYFCDGFKLVWTRNDIPRLFYNEVQISQYDMDERDIAESSQYATATNILWQIANINGQLIITSNVLNDEWIIGCHPEDVVYGRNDLAGDWAGNTDQPFIGDLPAAPWGIEGNSGQFAIRVVPFQFATEGFFETPWIEHYNDYGAQGFYWNTWGTLPVGCDAVVSEIAVNGTQKRYRVSMYGNGYSTPIVSAFQFYYMPSFAPTSKYWWDITPFVNGINVSTPRDCSARNVTIDLLPNVARGLYDSLWEYLGDILGTWSARVYVGYEYEDGTTSQMHVITGMTEIRNKVDTTSDITKLSLTIDDRWAKLNKTRLIFAPCVAGMSVDQAIVTIAQFAGIPPWQIDAQPLDLYLDSADYVNPSWYPTYGTSAGEFIRTIANVYGVAVEFDVQGILRIRRGYPTALMGTYTSIVSVTENNDTTGAENQVIVEGYARTGKPIFSSMYDWDSIYNPDSERFIGYPLTKYVKNHDLVTQQSVNLACACEFMERNAGWMQITVKSTLSDMWALQPHMYAKFIDSRTGFQYTARITNVQINSNARDGLMETIVTGEIR